MLLGGRVGFVYYLFLFAAVAFLLFSEEQWRLPSLLRAPEHGNAASYALTVVPGSARLLGRDHARRRAGHRHGPRPSASSPRWCIIVHLFTGDTTRAEARLAEEHERSERLLLNILPGPISARLKENGEAIADGFASNT